MKEYIGLITHYQQSIFQALVIAGVRDVIEPQGYHLLVDSVEKNPGEAVSLHPAQVLGLLVIANAVPNEVVCRLQASGVPLSLVSHQIEAMPAVMFNHAQGIRVLVKHLVETCGRQQVVFIQGIPQQVDAQRREAAFLQEMLRYHQVRPCVVKGEFSPEVAVASIAQLLQSGTPFDAILAADYIMAGAVVDFLRAQGLAVPGQVSVVGFGDAPEAEAAGITTVAADVRELGRRAALQLLSQMKGLKIRGTTTLSVQLVVRQTCGG